MVKEEPDHLAAGDSLREALLRSGRRRLRQTIDDITRGHSLHAALGISPLAIALLLSLVVTPTVYAILRRARRRAHTVARDLRYLRP